MGFFDLFWIFFLLTAVQPILKQKILESSREKIISKIEKKRGSRVILLIHRQETMSLLGFPLMKYIDINDSEEVIRAIHLTDPEIPIDLILHTPGGLVLAAMQIARAIKKHPAKVTAFIPHYAMSGGTLIALAADEIVMSPHSVLGPVDPQIGEYPAASILKLIKQKPIDKIEDRILILSDLAKKSISQVKSAVLELLSDRYPQEVAEKIASALSEGENWTHDYPITCEEARDLGLNINENMPQEIYELMSLYPQPVKSTPTVDYIPSPRFKTE